MVTVVVSVPDTAASASAASSSESEQFLQLINMERANAGVSAVTIGSQNLNDAAQARAQELTSRYSYVRPNGQREFTILSEYGVTDASVGEAYWAGTETPEETVAAWMAMSRTLASATIMAVSTAITGWSSAPTP